jgi:hypothetical protein
MGSVEGALGFRQESIHPGVVPPLPDDREFGIILNDYLFDMHKQIPAGMESKI